VVVRADLGLTKGKLAVQVAHAAVNCALLAKERDRRTFDSWYREGQKKIVAKATGLSELLEIRTIAQAKGLTTSLIEDAGLTQLEPGTTTCVGIGPAASDDVDPITGSLPLM
jgi:PTH2 family peptidyl-tRNA hydrolase